MVGSAFKQVLLCVQHDPAVFDGYFEAFDGGVFFFGPGLLDGDIVGADAQAVGVEDGAAGGDVEFPAVPGAAEDLAVAFPDDFAGCSGAGGAGDGAAAEGGALVGAEAAQGVVFAVDVEDTD